MYLIWFNYNLMAQSIPSDILPTLIKDSLKLRVEHLENVFKREETDLLTLHKHMTDIESNLSYNF